MSKHPPCPQCGKTRPAPFAGGRLRCNRCGTLYDANLNEGGDYHADPSKRLQIQEQERERAYRLRRAGNR